MIYKNNVLKASVVLVLLVGFLFVTLLSAEMDGAKIFRDNCVKCHSERSPMEKTDKEWTVVITHMRTIAGLTAAESKAVLKFLQENNGD